MATAHGAVAQWLADEFGADEPEEFEKSTDENEWMVDAIDLIEYLASKRILLIHDQYVSKEERRIARKVLEEAEYD